MDATRTDRVYQVGQLVSFASGEYSDYRIGSFSRVLKPINQDAWDAMRDACNDSKETGYEHYDEYKAVPWLVANGYIEELPYDEIHLGDYGNIPAALP